MRITDLLDVRSISLNAASADKSQTLDAAVSLMTRSGKINDEEAYRKQVYAREEESTTGIGEGIAIPHGKCDAVEKPGLAAMVIPGGVDFDSLDGEPVTLLFLIAAPNTEDNVHLDVLSKLSMMLMDEDFTKSLRAAKTPEEFLAIIDQADEEKKSVDERLADMGEAEADQFKILAVTSCPTGIAHTYMAAEGIEKAAKAKNCFVKIETRGSGGAKNVLTEQEIQDADCIIVAADAQVPMDRFDGKKVIQRQVSDGINKADELVELAMSGNVPVYHSGNASASSQSQNKAGGSVGHKIYTQLMNGVSHMLPFVVGGGILIAIAFLIDGLMVDMNALDVAERSNFGSITPAAAMFKQIGDVAFGFMLPVLAGYIAMSIGEKPALVSGFVGGYLANTGGSGFLGALLAGFAAGYGMLFIKKLLMFLPESLEGIKSVLLYPLLGVLLIGFLIQIVLNPPVKIINDFMFGALNSMGGVSRVLLGAVRVGMMAVDMGGPVNKAAYVFGTASIAEGNYEIMAAVMIGGMVPPIAIALCGTFFKNRFTEKEQKSSAVNYVMGLSFITEGAIPFAAADPARVIPACAIGSAAAGGLSMFFGCSLRAPHGGIFVLPIMEGRMMYIVSLIIGSVVGMILLALFKRKEENKNG